MATWVRLETHEIISTEDFVERSGIYTKPFLNRSHGHVFQFVTRELMNMSKVELALYMDFVRAARHIMATDAMAMLTAYTFAVNQNGYRH